MSDMEGPLKGANTRGSRLAKLWLEAWTQDTIPLPSGSEVDSESIIAGASVIYLVASTDLKTKIAQHKMREQASKRPNDRGITMEEAGRLIVSNWSKHVRRVGHKNNAPG